MSSVCVPSGAFLPSGRRGGCDQTVGRAGGAVNLLVVERLQTVEVGRHALIRRYAVQALLGRLSERLRGSLATRSRAAACVAHVRKVADEVPWDARGGVLLRVLGVCLACGLDALPELQRALASGALVCHVVGIPETLASQGVTQAALDQPEVLVMAERSALDLLGRLRLECRELRLVAGRQFGDAGLERFELLVQRLDLCDLTVEARTGNPPTPAVVVAVIRRRLRPPNSRQDLRRQSVQVQVRHCHLPPLVRRLSVPRPPRRGTAHRRALR